jgi:hypothetical protein
MLGITQNQQRLRVSRESRSFLGSLTIFFNSSGISLGDEGPPLDAGMVLHPYPEWVSVEVHTSVISHHAWNLASVRGMNGHDIQNENHNMAGVYFGKNLRAVLLKHLAVAAV